MKLSLKILSIIIGLCAGPAVCAAVYICTDNNGHQQYTSEKRAGCVEENMGTLSSYTPVSTADGYVDEDNYYNNANNDSGYVDSSYANTTASQAAATQTGLEKNLQDAQRNLEEGKKVRKGGEQNYAKYKRRIRALEAEVDKAQDALNQNKIHQVPPEVN